MKASTRTALGGAAKLGTLFLCAVLCGALTACAHAQVKPTQNGVALSWNAAAGCSSSSPCTYVISSIALAPGTASCPAPNVATPNYAPLNSSAPTSATAYTDNAAAGETVCYIAQTEQAIAGSTAVSAPSNTAGPYVVPANPSAPALSGSTTAAMRFEPPLPQPAPELAQRATGLRRTVPGE